MRGGYVSVEIIAPVLTNLRHYPVFIISGRKEYLGWDKAALDRVLQAHISGKSPIG